MASQVIIDDLHHDSRHPFGKQISPQFGITICHGSLDDMLANGTGSEQGDPDLWASWIVKTWLGVDISQFSD